MVRQWWSLQIYQDDPERLCLTSITYTESGLLPCVCVCFLFYFIPAVWRCSRGEVEGADGDSKGAPWQAHQRVQPHQPGAQPAGQETEEGKDEPEGRVHKIGLNAVHGEKCCPLK